MANYAYNAINSSGEEVQGTIAAASVQAAEEMIASGDLVPTMVSEEKGTKGLSASRLFTPGVKVHDLVLFSKQFRSMFRAGIPIIRILQVIETQTENKTLKKAVSAITEDIKAGATLEGALRKHPAIFSPLYCNIIKAGEISGNITDVMERLTYILEHENKVKSDVRSALQYPKVVLVTLGIAFFFLLGFVVPRFATIFSKAGLALPVPTRIAIFMHHALLGYWHIMLLAVIAVIFWLRIYFRTENGKFMKDSFVLRLPVFGPLFIKAAMSRFASILAILMSSGIPIMNAMTILSGTIGNFAISRAFDSIREQMEEGKGIAGPLSSVSFFTPMVINMVAVGEESGNLEGMLQEVTLHYDEEVRHAVSRLADLIGPVLTVALAAVVGFFALAIFMPMWDMTKMAVHH